MTDLTVAIRTLERKRDELLAQRDGLFRQLEAVNKAIDALTSVEKDNRGAVHPRLEPPPPAQKAVRRKRRFTLSEEHKRKLLEGQQRAREARAAATAQPPDVTAPLIAAWRGDVPPRLVKPEAAP
jgi:hypothetical protein